jgi:hypothetical protein
LGNRSALRDGKIKFTWPEKYCQQAIRVGRGRKREGKRAADVGVVGDVCNCVGDCVNTLRIFVGNFNSEFLFNGEHNLEEWA